MYIVYSFVLGLTFVLSQDSFFNGHYNLELSEGDVCDRTEEAIWTCQRPRNCPSAIQALYENKKPKICLYDDKTPIICCRETKPTTENYVNRMNYEEGDVCRNDKDGIWTCRFPENCPSAIEDLKKNKWPAICSYNDKTPIICCREPTRPNENLNKMKSKEACERYQNRCNELRQRMSTGTNNGDEPLPAPSNKKPDALYKAMLIVGEVKSDPKELPYTGDVTASAVGGVETAPKEYPHMGEFVLSAVGGVETAPKEYPHMALIGYGASNSISWSCGGSLISEQYVLSAAHCTYPGVSVGAARWVRLGDLNIATNNDDAKPEEYEIISTINHPGYRPPALYNDIALYKLNQSIIFTQYISPVCLQTFYDKEFLPFGKVIATGWGRIGPSGPKSKHLMKVDISIVPQDLCNDLIKQKRQLPRGIDEESMICAGELAGGKDTCQGDSGGPLMLQASSFACVHLQIGVTSFGRICGSERSPGVYTKVAKFIPWIESIVWPY